MLEINNLLIKYGDKVAVKDVSFKVLSGEIVGLIGNNGSGKTSIISAIMESVPFVNGTITLNNQNIKKSKDYKKYIGYLPEDVELYDGMSGRDFLSFASQFRHIQFPSTTSNELISYFNLDSLLDRLIGSYSKGNKQRLGIVLTMIHNPKLLILDEPFDGLDPASIEKYKKLLIDFKNKGGSILLSCHTLELVGKLCSRIYILNKGNIDKEISLSEYDDNMIEDLYRYLSGKSS